MAFLDSGKKQLLSLIQLQMMALKSKGIHLFLACEDGEVEYDETFLKDNNTSIEYINDVSEMNAINLDKLTKKHKPKRILIEFNGMWDFSNVVLPEYFCYRSICNFLLITKHFQHILLI
ncbi:MAG: hypothetical protein L6U99_11195 [Clostridium sp.]|nr:MAG: hypothetical protein L6U99_11195 [Clostridium sp.]